MTDLGPGIAFLAASFVAPIVEIFASAIYYARRKTRAGLGLLVGSVGQLLALIVSQYAVFALFPRPAVDGTGMRVVQLSGYAGIAFGLLFAFSLLAVVRDASGLRGYGSADDHADAGDPGGPV